MILVHVLLNAWQLIESVTHAVLDISIEDQIAQLQHIKVFETVWKLYCGESLSDVSKLSAICMNILTHFSLTWLFSAR